MENKITFTGLNNIYAGRKLYTNIGNYVTDNGEIKRGNKNYKELLIKCQLTDDKSGKDFSEFWDVLTKSNKNYSVRCLMNTTTDTLNFKVKRCEAPENVTNSNFTLNGIEILPNERSVLPLFTYLAKLTRKLAAISGNSQEKTELFKIANKSIQEEAEKFIENM